MDILEETNKFLSESDPTETSQNVLEGVKAGVLFEDIPGLRTKAHMMGRQKNPNRDPKETLRRFLTGGIQ